MQAAPGASAWMPSIRVRSQRRWRRPRTRVGGSCRCRHRDPRKKSRCLYTTRVCDVSFARAARMSAHASADCVLCGSRSIASRPMPAGTRRHSPRYRKLRLGRQHARRVDRPAFGTRLVDRARRRDGIAPARIHAPTRNRAESDQPKRISCGPSGPARGANGRRVAPSDRPPSGGRGAPEFGDHSPRRGCDPTSCSSRVTRHNPHALVE